MKKALITITTMALLGAAVPQANAGGGGAVAAGVIGGLGAGLIIGSALQPRPVYAATPVYVSPAPVVVQQPAQQVVMQQPTDQQVVVQQPVQTAQQPVVVQQQPVVVQSPQVVYAPAPVYYPGPVYVRPYYAPPVVTFGFSFGHGGGYYGHGYRHGYRHW
jgi:hypothetical protein